MIFYRPDYMKKNYQGLRDNLSALEPPIWMSRAKGIYDGDIVDEFIGDNLVVDNHDRLMIFPSGNNPASAKENYSDMREISFKLSLNKFVRMAVNFLEDDVERPTDWRDIDLKRYRAHNWHCWGGKPRSPYGALFTSVGCPFNCKMCCINDYYGGYKRRSLDVVLRDLDILALKRVKNLKIIDELFMADQKYVEKICDYLISKDYGFNIWAYSRTNHLPKQLLKKMKKAGINWLCLGIESGNQEIRKINGKGDIDNKDIISVCKEMEDSGISILANYIFGFYEDTAKTMEETFDLAQKINAGYSNFYSMMPYFGSQIYTDSVKRGFYIARTSNELSQYGANCRPLRTKTLSSGNVLRFRDTAFKEYYGNSKYLNKLKKTFGNSVIKDIELMRAVKLQRNYA
jgi:anaerobic magnesium-protoporphyrin IX monomethyl ester cyclase